MPNNFLQGQPNQRMDINEYISQMEVAKSRGVNPDMIIQQAIQRNPNVRLLQQRLDNMAQGRSPKEFIIQLAKQKGATEENAQKLAKIFGV